MIAFKFLYLDFTKQTTIEVAFISVNSRVDNNRFHCLLGILKRKLILGFHSYLHPSTSQQHVRWFSMSLMDNMTCCSYKLFSILFCRWISLFFALHLACAAKLFKGCSSVTCCYYDRGTLDLSRMPSFFFSILHWIFLLLLITSQSRSQLSYIVVSDSMNSERWTFPSIFFLPSENWHWNTGWRKKKSCKSIILSYF